jgi:hypothetical protein
VLRKGGSSRRFRRYQLLSVLRQRNWTDHDLAERVLPHARFGAEGVAEALPHTVTEGATTSVALVCPRGHTQQTEVAVDGAIIKTRCSRCGSTFVAIANVLCKGIARERYSRTRSYYGIVFSSRTTRTSTTVRIRYRNPSPPPEERLVAFVTRGTSAEFQLKSGDHVSITLKKKAPSPSRHQRHQPRVGDDLACENGGT